MNGRRNDRMQGITRGPAPRKRINRRRRRQRNLFATPPQPQIPVYQPTPNSDPVIRAELKKIRKLERRLAKQTLRDQGFKEAKKDENPWWDRALDIGGKFLAAAGPALFGFGDYEVETNSLVAAASGGKIGSGTPHFGTSGKSTDRHVMSEYIGDIIATTADFSMQVFPIQPGLQTSFSWLATIAKNYEKFRIHGIVYEYRPLSGVLSGTQALGYVAMNTLYNTGIDPRSVFVDKRTIENHKGGVSEAPDKCIMAGVECKRNLIILEDLYVRTGAVSTDLRFNDLGNFCIANGGQGASGAVLGELWVSYDIEFFEPLTTSVQTAQYAAHYYLSGSSSSVTIPPNANAMKIYDTIGLDFPGSNTVAIKVPNTKNLCWFFLFLYTGSGTSITAFSPTYGSCDEILNIADGALSNIAFPVLGGSPSDTAFAFVTGIKSTVGPGNYASITLSATGTLPDNLDIFVFQVPTVFTLASSLKAITSKKPLSLDYFDQDSISDEEGSAPPAKSFGSLKSGQQKTRKR